MRERLQVALWLRGFAAWSRLSGFAALWRDSFAGPCSPYAGFDFRMCFSPQRRAIFRRQNFKKCFGADVFCTFSLPNVFSPQRRAIFRHQNFKKCSEHVVFCTLYIFTSKCAFRHSGMQFFDIRTSKSAPSMWCFVHCTFSLQNVFRHSGVQFLISPRTT